MTLLEVVQRLADLDRDHTIYARKPWTLASEALVVTPPPDGSTTPIGGMTYFLEVAIAEEVLEDWQQDATTDQRCQRLIDYATNDA